MEFTTDYRGHQGDVQIFSIANIPANAKKIAKTFFAKSEKSGHAHAMCGDYELFESESGHIVKVGSDGATLNHTGYHNLTADYWDKNQLMEVADHKPTVLKEGVYFIGIQRRKKPFSKVWEKVTD
jgi:hypothetical protein